jgi:hypothetical protein
MYEIDSHEIGFLGIGGMLCYKRWKDGVASLGSRMLNLTGGWYSTVRLLLYYCNLPALDPQPLLSSNTEHRTSIRPLQSRLHPTPLHRPTMCLHLSVIVFIVVASPHDVAEALAFATPMTILGLSAY